MGLVGSSRSCRKKRPDKTAVEATTQRRPAAPPRAQGTQDGSASTRGRSGPECLTCCCPGALRPVPGSPQFVLTRVPSSRPDELVSEKNVAKLRAIVRSKNVVMPFTLHVLKIERGAVRERSHQPRSPPAGARKRCEVVYQHVDQVEAIVEHLRQPGICAWEDKSARKKTGVRLGRTSRLRCA